MLPNTLFGKTTALGGALTKYQEKDGTEYTFDNYSFQENGKQIIGRLTSIKNASGDAVLTITYDDNLPTRTTLVKRVQSSASTGRFLDFTYTGNQVEVSRYEYNQLVDKWVYSLGSTYAGDGYSGTTNKRLIQVKHANQGTVVTSYSYYTSGAAQTKGLMQSITEPNGEVHQYEYYANGRVFRVIDGAGNQQSYNYNLFRNITEFTDERGNVETYIHQDNGLLTRQIHDDRSRQEFTWGGVGSVEEYLMTSSTDELGAKESFVYYSPSLVGGRRGELKESTAKDGLVTHYDYSTAPLSYISGLGKVTVDPTGANVQTIYERDAYGRLLSMADAEGNVTKYEYYASNDPTTYLRGLLKSETLPKGTSGDEAVSWGTLADNYTVWGNTLSVQLFSTNVSGQLVIADAVRIDRIDGNTALTRIIDESTVSNSSFRLETGSYTSSTLPTTYEADYIQFSSTGTEQPVATWIFTDLAPGTYRISATWPSSPSNDPTTKYRIYSGLVDGANYQEISDVSQQTAPNSFRSFQTVYTYDTAGNIIKATTEGLPTTNRTYDAFGNVKTEQDATGVVTNNAYDALGRLIKSSVNSAQSPDPVGVSTTTATYDPWRIQSTTDPLGHITTNKYDGNGRLVKQTLADGTVLEHKYDEAGNCIATTDGLGHTTRFVYDSRNRVIETIYADGTSTRTRYDGAGHVVQSIDELGHVTEFTYDKAGRLLTTKKFLQYPDSPTSPTTEIVSTNEYDKLGNLVRITDANGNVTLNQFDKLGRVIETRTLKTNGATGAADPSLTPATVTTTGYDANGNIDEQITYDTASLGALIPTWYVSPPINFESYQLYSFNGANQTPILDTSGSPHPEDDGRSLFMDGNSRKAIEINYTFNSDTVLELDFKKLADGELFGIGVTDSLTTPQIKAYRFDGTDPTLENITTWENTSPSQPPSSDGTKHYRIPIGNAISPGQHRYLVFVNRDRGVYGNSIQGQGKSLFSNVRVYNAASLTSLAQSHPDQVEVVKTTYDAFGHPIQTTNADGTTTSTIYDAAGRVRFTIDELGHKTENVYDRFGRLERIISPDPDGIGPLESSYTRYEYDAAGNVIKQWDLFDKSGAANVEFADQFAYDARNRLVTTIRKDGTRLDSVLNPVGQVVATVDGLGNSTFSVYDDRGRVIEQRQADPDGSGSQAAPVTTHEYDSAGNVASTTDPLGNTTSFEYDSLNRLRKESHNDTIIADDSNVVGDVEFRTVSALRHTIDDPGSYGGDKMIVAGGNPVRAIWTFNNLAAGTYSIALSDRIVANSAASTTVKVLDDANNQVYLVALNQVRKSPSLRTIEGQAEIAWHGLNYYPVIVSDGSALSVELSLTGGGAITADAVRLDRTVSTQHEYDKNGNLISDTDTRGNITRYYHDELNRLDETISTDPDGAGSDLSSLVTERFYDGYGNVASEKRGYVDVNQPATYTVVRTDTFQYDQRNRLVTQTLDSGQGHENVITRFVYDRAGNKVMETDPRGFRTRYRYDALNRVIDKYQDVTNPLPAPTVVAPANPQPYGNLDGARAASTWSYQGGALTISGDAWKSASVAYTVKYNTVLDFDVESDWAAELVAIAVDTDNNANGAPGQFYILGGVDLPLWDSPEFQIQGKPDGKVTFHIPIGQYLSQNDQVGGLAIAKLVFINADGRPGLALADRGTTKFSNIKLYESDEVRTATTYDDRGNVETVRTASDPRDITTRFEYDRLGRQTKKILDDGGSMERQYVTVYDATGNALIEQNPSVAVGSNDYVQTVHEYDRLGRLVQTTLPDPDGLASTPNGLVTKFAYDDAGNLISQTNGEGETTGTAYDAQGHTISETDGNGHQTRYRYDSEGNLTAVIDPDQNVTNYTYDGLNRQKTEKITALVNGVAQQLPRTNTYDPQGNLLSITDRNGRLRQFTYDKLNRQTKEEWQDTAGGPIVHRLTWDYDDLGQVVKETDSGPTLGTTADDLVSTFAYDGLGRLTDQKNYDASSTGRPLVHQKFQYGFDYESGSFHDDVTRDQYLNIGLSDIGVATTVSTFDKLGQLQYVVDDDNSSNPTSPQVDDKSLTFSYDAAGNLSQIDRFHPNTTASSTLTYDKANRLTDIEHQFPVDTQYGYVYDNASRITSTSTFTDYDEASGHRYAYDDAGQLTARAEINGAPEFAYAYDPNGNRQSVNSQAVLTDLDNRLKSDGTYIYAYDNEGNLATRTRISAAPASDYTTTYTWDHRNRLTGVTFKNNSGAVTKTVGYTYDAEGRRVKRAIDPDGSGGQSPTSEYFIYDGSDLSMRFDNAQKLSHRYLYGPETDQVLADEVFSAVGASTDTIWYGADNENSIRDTYGVVSQSYQHLDYDAFGNIEQSQGVAQAAGGGESVDATDQLFAFTGQEWDKDAKLYNYNARWYDPAMGRFISEDPSGFDAGDANLFRYVGNDPINNTDPTGLQLLTPTQSLTGFGAGSFSPYAQSLAYSSTSLIGASRQVLSTPIDLNPNSGYIGTSYPDYSHTSIWDLGRGAPRPDFGFAPDPAPVKTALEPGILSKALTYTKATGAGLLQGVANLGNVATDAAIAVPNSVPLVWNYTAGWVAPNIPYIPSPDWSRNLVPGAYETDAGHSWSKGFGNVGLTAGTIAVSVAGNATRAAEAAAAERASQAAAEARATAEALESARATASSSKLTGEIHHPISKPIFNALEEHPNLAGQYTPRDPRFTTQAIDEAAHRGYQTWHRELDAEVSQWIKNNPQGTPQTFEGWLGQRYSQPDLKARFPNGF